MWLIPIKISSPLHHLKSSIINCHQIMGINSTSSQCRWLIHRNLILHLIRLGIRSLNRVNNIYQTRRYNRGYLSLLLNLRSTKSITHLVHILIYHWRHLMLLSWIIHRVIDVMNTLLSRSIDLTVKCFSFGYLRLNVTHLRFRHCRHDKEWSVHILDIGFINNKGDLIVLRSHDRLSLDTRRDD